MNNYEELKRELKEKAKNPEELGEVFAKHNITPDNPEVLQQFLKNAGFQNDITPDKAANMVKEATKDLPQDIKKQMADLIFGISKDISETPMPDDLKDMLKKWKGE